MLGLQRFAGNMVQQLYRRATYNSSLRTMATGTSQPADAVEPVEAARTPATEATTKKPKGKYSRIPFEIHIKEILYFNFRSNGGCCF